MAPPVFPETPCPEPLECRCTHSGNPSLAERFRPRRLDQLGLWSRARGRIPSWRVRVFDEIESPPCVIAPDCVLEVLAERRRLVRMSFRALAKRSGVSLATVKRALASTARPESVSLDTVQRISNALGARMALLAYSPRRVRFLGAGVGERTLVSENASAPPSAPVAQSVAVEWNTGNSRGAGSRAMRLWHREKHDTRCS